jgi:hypothetical protein
LEIQLILGLDHPSLFPALLCGWYSHDKAVSAFVILSAEKVCRLFRGAYSGLAAQIAPLHKQHTYSANHKLQPYHAYTFIIPARVSFFLFSGKVFKRDCNPLNSSPNPIKLSPYVFLLSVLFFLKGNSLF